MRRGHESMTKVKIYIGRFAILVLLLVGCATAASGATIDVMIVYETKAKAWVDSRGGMNAFAADAVGRMNLAMTNSNVNVTFRLVHAAAVSYTTDGDLSTDLSNLQIGSGNLSVVHQWRNTYGADVVALLVDTGSAYGWVGYGYLLSSYKGAPDWAFTASAIRSVDISHTLTHEVGHNLGVHHSKYQTSSPGPNTYLNTYSAGWYLTGTNAKKYHTIMAYNSDGYGNSYSEAPLFSTPLLNYQGVPAGHAQHGDNARTIRETMSVVSAYRPEVTPSLPPPAAVQATKGAYVDKVAVSWNGVTGATGYKVYRNAVNDGTAATQIGSPSASPFADTTAAPWTFYYYWVKAIKGSTESLLSETDIGYRKAASYHPADTSKDFRIVIDECVAYAFAWKTGAQWVTDPNPIPIGYMTNACYLWKMGEAYPH